MSWPWSQSFRTFSPRSEQHCPPGAARLFSPQPYQRQSGFSQEELRTKSACIFFHLFHQLFYCFVLPSFTREKAASIRTVALGFILFPSLLLYLFFFLMNSHWKVFRIAGCTCRLGMNGMCSAHSFVCAGKWWIVFDFTFYAALCTYKKRSFVVRHQFFRAWFWDGFVLGQSLLIGISDRKGTSWRNGLQT